MNWNYRVMRKVCDSGESYAMYEVFYHEDGVTAKVWMENPVSVYSETHTGVLDTLEKMKVAYENQYYAIKQV